MSRCGLTRLLLVFAIGLVGLPPLTTPQKIPFIGSYFVNEIPPEDNVSNPCFSWT